MFRNFKVLLIALIVIAVAGGVYGFAAANTVPDTAAGYKASVVSGYTITNIAYDLDATDPTIVDAITFAAAPAPSMNVTCTYGALPLADVTALNIVASGTTDAP